MPSSNLYLNRYYLGRWYASYRFIITFSLLLIAFITHYSNVLDLPHSQLYLTLLFFYFVINSAQWLSLIFLRFAIPSQLLGFFIIDALFFNALTYANEHINLQLSILFVTTIFAASLLLEQKKALSVTLVSVICIIYPHFIGSIFDFSALNNIGNSALLAILLFGVYALGQFSIRRFQLLERVNLTQAAELQRLQEISRSVLNQVETGYLAVDENFHVVFTTPAACQFLAIAPTYSYRKQPLYSIQPHLFDALYVDGYPKGEKFQFTVEQNNCHLHIQVQELHLPNQTLTLLVLEDARTLNQRVQQLKLAALGQLSASIAHEIRNPLAAIMQANQLMLDSSSAQQQMLHDMIHKQAERINKIVQDTLSMARSHKIQPNLIDLAQFIPMFLGEDLADSQHNINVSIEKNCVIYFDDVQFRQVLINLLRNALRHNDSAQNNVELHIYTQHNHSIIEVRDFGSGVATHDIASLFRPFFSTSINGTGLGLYLSHSFCEANQAKLYYVEQQKGACFRIECVRFTIS